MTPPLHRLAVLPLTALALALTMSEASPAAPKALSAHGDEPRAFGYTVGDMVSRRIALEIPPGLKLAEDSLPRVGGQGRALELRRVALRRSISGVPEELQLDYQVFLAPREVRVLEMPPMELRFEGTPRVQTLRIDAWPVTVAPLAPVDASPREGLGEMRPDREPPRVDTSAVRARLAMEGALVLLLLGYLAHVYIGVPWQEQRRRPFGLAWKALRSMPAAAALGERRAAFERLHAALNQTAGEVVFEPGLARFVAMRPQFAPLRSELASFFARSRDEFFAAESRPVDTAWLVAFARRCRDAERGAA